MHASLFRQFVVDWLLKVVSGILEWFIFRCIPGEFGYLSDFLLQGLFYKKLSNGAAELQLPAGTHRSSIAINGWIFLLYQVHNKFQVEISGGNLCELRS